jgi:hypothetical protein
MTDALRWHDIADLTIEGKGWPDTADTYDRLPARAEGVVRDPVWNLSRQTAGLCAQFVTDASAISVRWALRHQALAMSHMAATGVSGQAHGAKRAALRAAFDQLSSADDSLHYQPGADFMGDDAEATVDGSHPTDVGFMRQARCMLPLLRRVLGA